MTRNLEKFIFNCKYNHRFAFDVKYIIICLYKQILFYIIIIIFNNNTQFIYILFIFTSPK